MKIKLYKPLGIQPEIIKAVEDPSINYIIVSCGRRAGKSMTNINVCTKYALTNPGSKILYIVPAADQRETIFTEYLQLFGKAPFINKVDHSIKNINLGNNSIIKFRLGSMPSARSLKGNAFDFLVIDEAALIQPIVWEEILSATLATTPLHKLKVLFTSTPRSKDWFYKMYTKGLDPNLPNYKSIHAPSVSNPLVTLQYIEDMKLQLPTNIFRQEFLAEFLEDSGGLFENINTNTIDTTFSYDKNKKYFCGIDTGFKVDSTVCVIIDENGNLVDYTRFSQTEMKIGAKMVHDLLKKWNYPKGYVENNQYQGFHEMLEDLGTRNIELFMTTGKSKPEIVEDLCSIFQSNEIKLPNDEYLLSEFYNFSYIYNPKTRRIAYAAAGNGHDDIVMATAIAFKAKKDMKFKKLNYSI
jgi:hypothetical protein